MSESRGGWKHYSKLQLAMMCDDVMEKAQSEKSGANKSA